MYTLALRTASLYRIMVCNWYIMCGLTENHFSDIIVMYTYLRYDYAVVSGEKSILFTPPYMYVAIFLGCPVQCNVKSLSLKLGSHFASLGHFKKHALSSEETDTITILSPDMHHNRYFR